MDDRTEERYYYDKYNHLLNLISIGITGFYAMIWLFRYIQWRHRRQISRSQSLKRRRLEYYWRKRLMIHPRTLEYPSKSYHPSHKQTGRHMFSEPTTYDSSTTLIVPNQHTLGDKDGCFMGRSISLLDDLRNKLHHQRRKKRNIMLYQWSVDMGYCKYDHGHHLDAIITELSEKKNKRVEEKC